MTVRRAADVEFMELPGRVSGDPLVGLGATSSVRLARPERTTSRMAHRHPHSEEVIFVKAGTGAIYIEGDLHRVAPGDTILVPAGAAHATIPDMGEVMDLVCFFPHPELTENLLETDIDVMKEVEQ